MFQKLLEASVPIGPSSHQGNVKVLSILPQSYSLCVVFALLAHFQLQNVTLLNDLCKWMIRFIHILVAGSRLSMFWVYMRLRKPLLLSSLKK